MSSTTSLSNRTNLFVAAGVAVLAVIGGVVSYLSGYAPDAVSINEAAASLQDDEAAAEDDAPASADDTAAAEGIDGTWTVDTSIGEFSVLETTGTFVGFRIDEELSTIGETEAVGRTPGVEGEITIEDGTMTAATFTADVTIIESDDSRRNDKIFTALEAGTFPTATFTLTDPVEVGEIADGEVVDVTAEGTLTVHGVEQPVTVPLQATVQDGVAIVTGSFEITFADYDVQVPSAPIVLSVSDVGDVEFQLFLTR